MKKNKKIYAACYFNSKDIPNVWHGRSNPDWSLPDHLLRKHFNQIKTESK